jgi:membrane-bound lytic murein transglycosylase D
MKRKRAALLLVTVLMYGVGYAGETFPLPEALQPDVDFWVRIFTAVNSDQGVLHDDRHLGVIYTQLEVPLNLSRREQRRRINAARDEIKAILGSLAGGKRDDLSPEQSRVLAAWPADVSNETLRAAAGRIRFQRGLSDRFRAGLVRSGRWRQFIEREFREIGIPADIVALPHVESSFNPDARSSVGASGIWQFTRSTGRRFMQVDHVLDERNDPWLATRAAGRLLAYNYSITGNWPTAITAYNHGLAGIRRAMRKFGDDAYVDIFREYDGRTFGFASRNFYLAFLAAREVDRTPEKYFPGIRLAPPEERSTFELPGYLPIDTLADRLGISVDEIARHNLAIQPTVLTGSKHLPRGFSIGFPEGVLSAPLEDLVATIPDNGWANEQLPDLFHTVARGDTLSEIARDYETSVGTLVALNGLGSQHRIRAGQQLRLPAAGPAPAAAAKAEAPPVAVEAAVEAAVAGAGPAPVAADVDEVAPSALAGEPVAEAGPEPAQTELLSDPSDYSVADDGTIEVHPLETLGHFADWLGIRTQRLRDINGLAFRTPVEVGQRLRLEFDEIDAAGFESRRVAWHRDQQDRYFREHVIEGVREHEIQRGESVWILSLREYGVPLWLFRQYNPGLDLHRVRPGIKVRFPVLADRDGG